MQSVIIFQSVYPAPGRNIDWNIINNRSNAFYWPPFDVISLHISGQKISNLHICIKTVSEFNFLQTFRILRYLDIKYVRGRLKSSLDKFYGRYWDLSKHDEVPLSQMLHDIMGHDHISRFNKVRFLSLPNLNIKGWSVEVGIS